MAGIKRGLKVVCGATAALAILLAAPASAKAASSGTVQFSARVLASNGTLGFGPITARTTAIGTVAGFQVSASNPGQVPLPVFLTVHNADFSAAKGISLPAPVTLQPGQTRHFVVQVPVEPGLSRRLRICVRSTGGEAMCGKFIADALPPR